MGGFPLGPVRGGPISHPFLVVLALGGPCCWGRGLGPSCVWVGFPPGWFGAGSPEVGSAGWGGPALRGGSAGAGVRLGCGPGFGGGVWAAGVVLPRVWAGWGVGRRFPPGGVFASGAFPLALVLPARPGAPCARVICASLRPFGSFFCSCVAVLAVFAPFVLRFVLPILDAPPLGAARFPLGAAAV